MVAVKAVVTIMGEVAATADLKSQCLVLSLGILRRNLGGLLLSTRGKEPSLLHLYFQDFCYPTFCISHLIILLFFFLPF